MRVGGVKQLGKITQNRNRVWLGVGPVNGMTTTPKEGGGGRKMPKWVYELVERKRRSRGGRLKKNNAGFINWRGEAGDPSKGTYRSKKEAFTKGGEQATFKIRGSPKWEAPKDDVWNILKRGSVQKSTSQA